MSEIPKIIHYCWFGGKKKPKKITECLKTWRKVFPEYKIMEWKEENFPIESANEFVREAYQLKKYAFVSDYVRLEALYQYGGIYLDTDVEVVQDFSPLLRNVGLVSGFELVDSVMTGFIACTKGNDVIREFLDTYKNKKFVREDGQLNDETNPVQFTNLLEARGLKRNGKYQEFNGKIRIYPIEYFCAFDLHNDCVIQNENTYTIHHYTGTWESKGRVKKKLKRAAASLIGKDNYRKVRETIKNR